MFEMLIFKTFCSKYYYEHQQICSNFLSSHTLSGQFKKEGHNLFSLISKSRLIRGSCIYPSFLQLWSTLLSLLALALCIVSSCPAYSWISFVAPAWVSQSKRVPLSLSDGCNGVEALSLSQIAWLFFIFFFFNWRDGETSRWPDSSGSSFGCPCAGRTAWLEDNRSRQDWRGPAALMGASIQHWHPDLSCGRQTPCKLQHAANRYTTCTIRWYSNVQQLY